MRRQKLRLQNKRLPKNNYENQQTKVFLLAKKGKGWGEVCVEVVEFKHGYFTFYIYLAASFSRETVKRCICQKQENKFQVSIVRLPCF